MIKNWDKKRIKDLGIFYTPQEVVDFIFEILNIWKENQANRWKTKESKTKYPSVIDPSVGEGIFLKTALSKKFTNDIINYDKDFMEKASESFKLYENINNKRLSKLITLNPGNPSTWAFEFYYG